MATARPLDSHLSQRSRFRAFLISRLGNEADADDLLQNGRLKAVRAAGAMDDAEKLNAWFYRLLRDAPVDHVRSRTAASRRDGAWAAESGTLADDPEAERNLCV